MIKVNFFKYVVLVFLCFLSSCAKSYDWYGVYLYEHSFGQSQPGIDMVVDYELSLQDNHCLLSVKGYQTDDQIICKIIKYNNNEMVVEFVSYADGSVQNAYGIEIYKPGLTLFTLNEEHEDITTIWGELSPDKKLPKKGKYFNKQSQLKKN